MRLSEVVLGSWIALGCAGCPGTIEDPAGFDALQQASQRDGGTEGDAGSDAEVSAQDAAPDGSEVDASTLQEAGPAPIEDASTGWDGALRDAGDAAADAAETGADTGIGCDLQALLQQQCNDCHGAAMVSNTLDLTSPDLAQRLAGRMGTGSCSSYLLIDPENPRQSALYLKVTPEKCGSRMPLGNTLTDGQQACILRWIESLN